MVPVNYKKDNNGNIHFIYKFSDLKWFVKHGKKNGNVGFIITDYNNNNTVTRKGFGTIENPCKTKMIFTLKHLPEWDGGEFSIDKIMNPSKYKKDIYKYLESYRMVILNLAA